MKASASTGVREVPSEHPGPGRGLISSGRLKLTAARSVLLALCLFVIPMGARGQLLNKGSNGQQSNQNTSSAPRDSAGPYRYTNRLIHQKSPYLLLHAHNPVDWYAWGEEAFSKARRENKPIFLSVGYFTCHWCHVMERESYSNPAIAKLLNGSFVAVKVDREERPDVDSTYMSFVEATTGSGGWPMNVFLTPELKPFFGGTYFPPEDRLGRPGLKTVLPRIAETWRDHRREIVQSADKVTGQLQNFVNQGVGNGGSLKADLLDRAYTAIRQGYDSANGGFGRAPKFPRPVTLEFLLRYWKRTGKPEALDMALHTLRAMAGGGMHDALGGGFHRYSTDEFWRVPHFEKMLYDQAQLALVYTEAYQISHDQFYADVARDTLDFVLREMRGPGGGFYSALDADSQIEKGKSEHGEGAFYVWRAAETGQVLGTETADVFDFRYGVKPEGNVPAGQDIEGWLKGKNVLYEQNSLSGTAQKFHRSQAETNQLLQEARRKLFEARSLRARPPTDTKIITSWNGMMISALARASQVLEEPRYLEAATRAASFVLANLYQPATSRLKRRYRGGSVEVDGYLDDYASLINGLLDLYEAGFDVRLLSVAVRLQQNQDRLFWDPKQGGYYTTTGSDPSIVLRTREAYDGAEPSPNSVAALNLLRLWQVTGQQAWKDKADKTLSVFAPRLGQFPEAMPYMMAALDSSLAQHRQIVIVGAPAAGDTHELLRLVWQRYLPNRLLLLADGGQGQRQLSRWLPLLSSVTRKEGRATAYICENYVCRLPTSDPQIVAKLLDSDK